MTQPLPAATSIGNPIANSSDPMSAMALNLEPLIRPEVIGWWPLSYGAWLTIIAGMIAIGLLLWLIVKVIRNWLYLRRQRQRATTQLVKICDEYRYAIQDLTAEQCFSSRASEQLCQGINTLCKQHLLALTQHYFDVGQSNYREVIQQRICLTGVAWSDYMANFETSSRPWFIKHRDTLLSPRILNIIAQGPYRPAQQLPMDQLQPAIARWLTQINQNRIKKVCRSEENATNQEASQC